MKVCSLPIKQPDGSIVVSPLRLQAVRRGIDAEFRQNREDSASATEDSRIARARILRDIAILAVLATTIVACSTVLVITIWRDIVVAESNARIVEAQEAASARIVEAQSRAVSSKHFNRNLTFVIAIGFGVAVVVLLLARQIIIVGR